MGGEFVIFGGLCCFIGLGLLFFISNLRWVVFLSFNLASFLIMAKDKFQAGRGGLSAQAGERVPELFFYLVALAGGSLGVLGGVFFFHHKQSKDSFLAVIFLILLVQMLVTVALMK